MIAFSCTRCGMRLQVQPEFAGRSSRCPTCKHAWIVPAAEPVQAVPVGPIDGPCSSVHQAGLDPGVTLTQAGQESVPELPTRQAGKGERYLIAGEIARGGMGAVLRAVDCDIRREVAVKYLLDQADPKKKLRFAEEAQITGQLEHPNIPPVHELGVDAQKRLFFAMKMVKGRSLAQVLDQLREQPNTAEKQWPLSRLLTIFVNVCHGVAYAHARGVVHRDLKPANIMVGDFGEVYVMDWGLAKVLASGVASAPRDPGASSGAVCPRGADATPLAARGADATPLALPVVTDREKIELTQQGAMIGTPAYMPPEQADGNVQVIGPRSDVYSLGAILYEMLALQPPVEIEFGFTAILSQILLGQIMPPEERARRGGSVSARSIPRELSAIAMKALAKEPKDRYAGVEDLRCDVERFQEGRSVSAKEDTKGEMIVKFIRRNKGFSAGVAAALLILLTSVVVLYHALQETRAAQAALGKEHAEKEMAQEEKRQQLVRSVPTLVRSARLLADDGDVDEAQRQVTLALDYDPTSAEAQLLKGQLFIAQQSWEAGRAQLARYLQMRPGDAETQKFLALCVHGRKEDTAFLVAVAEVFQKQKLFGVAARVLQGVRATVKDREPLLALYQKQIDNAWPGQKKLLSLEPNGRFRLNFHGYDQLSALDPLRGIPLNELILAGCARITDLSPLRGMPLAHLDLSECHPVNDLAPLRGMPLTSLKLQVCQRIEDLAPLKGMRLTTLDLGFCVKVRDLTPLQGMPLTWLSLADCPQVRDLAPLKGMSLTWLSLWGTHVTDLTPLKGMPLTCLHLGDGEPVLDLAPLQGMQLTEIRLIPRHIKTGMDVLRRMKSLKTIHCHKHYAPDEFWKKYDAGEFNK